MILSRDEAEKIATKQLKTLHEKSEAENLENRIRLHSVGDDPNDDYVETFLNWVKPQVSREKFDEFKQVMTYPLATVGLVDNIFDDLSKLFEAENANYTAINFKQPAGITGRDYERKHKFKDMMKERVFRMFLAHPNSFWVVEPNDAGDPELYYVHLSHYIDHKYSNNHTLEYLAWTKDEKAKSYVIVDDAKFHYFTKDKNSNEMIYTTKSHNCGQVPADLIYKSFFTDEDTLKVKSPLAKRVGEMDWLLFWKLAKKVLDKSGPFPIYSHYRFPCNYEDASGNQCENGKLMIEKEDEATGESTSVVVDCPKCSGSISQRMIAGSRIEIPAPETKEDVDLRDPVQVLSAEQVSIEFAVSEEERLENAIFYSLVGKSLVPLEAFSASETQIDVATESRKNVFLKLSKVFQLTHKKIVSCYARIEHGDSFLSEDITYGTNWFLRTAEAEVAHYKVQKEAGMPQQIRLAQLRQVIKNQYSTDSDECTKQLLLLEAEPFVLSSVEEVKTMFDQKLVDKNKLALKVYFNSIIEEIEDEVGHLGSFINRLDGGSSTKRKKILELLNKKLASYVSLVQAEPPVEEKPEPGNPSGLKDRTK